MHTTNIIHIFTQQKTVSFTVNKQRAQFLNNLFQENEDFVHTLPLTYMYMYTYLDHHIRLLIKYQLFIQFNSMAGIN